MATFTATKAGSTVQARATLHITEAHGSITLTAAPALNDVFQMVKVPAGATVLYVAINSTDMDTNGTPTLNFDVGDGGDTDRFITNSQVGRTGGTAKSTNLTGMLYQYTTEDTIDIVCSQGPATGATGTLKLTAYYTMEQ